MLSDADSYATPFETNISRATLVTGYTSSLVPNAATIIRALSSGSCTNYVDLSITSSIPPTTTTTTTTTSTTTTTTTAAPTTTSTTTTTTTAAPTTTTSTTTTTTTAAPTTTTSTTTTTTTALPSYSYLVNGSPSVSAGIACSATKNVYLWSYFNDFTDGTTYYEGTSMAPTTPLVVYAGADRWKSNGIVAVQIDDSGFATNVTSCPTTTTSTTTTTTTTTPTTSTTTTTTTDPYDYYIADEINCSNCSVIAADQRVAFPIGTSVTLNRYYRYVGFENDFTYFVKEVTTTGGAVALELPAYTNCNAACGNTTTTSTTTTTTTAAPTTSTTTTTTTAASTTTSTTTTTTTTIGYDFYYADDYSCADPCGLYAAAQIVAFPAGSSVTNNKFYSWSGGTDSFKITGTTIDPSYPVPLLYPADGPFNSCTLACPV